MVALCMSTPPRMSLQDIVNNSDVSYMIVPGGLRPAGVAGHPDVENGEEREV